MRLPFCLMNTDGTLRSHRRLTANENGLPSMGWNEDFGKSVASIGDLDGDGRRELIVAPRRRHLRLFLRTMIRRSVRETSQHELSSIVRLWNFVSGRGDLDGDGVDELGVGDTSMGSNIGGFAVVSFDSAA